MKILVALSGGADSTALLYNLLRETEHEVVAIHIAEGKNEIMRSWIPLKRAAADAVSSWLRVNVRDFDLRFVDAVTEYGNGDPIPDIMEAHGEGFEKTKNRYTDRCRYATYGRVARELEVDEVRTGKTTWRHKPSKRSAARNWTVAADTYLTYTNIPLRLPWLESQMGKLQVYRTMPAPLRLLANDCLYPGSCSGCAHCLPAAFYKNVCLDLSDEQLAKLEEHLERTCSYNRYWDMANPETYDNWMLYNYWIREDMYGWWGDWVGRGMPEAEVQ